MNSYSRIYTLLTEELIGEVRKSDKKTRWDRKALAARLANREAGSMLTRKNQRRLTKTKAKIKTAFKSGENNNQADTYAGEK